MTHRKQRQQPAAPIISKREETALLYFNKLYRCLFLVAGAVKVPR